MNIPFLIREYGPHKLLGYHVAGTPNITMTLKKPLALIFVFGRKKKKRYACRDSNSGFPACEAGVITRLDHTRLRSPGLEPES